MSTGYHFRQLKSIACVPERNSLKNYKIHWQGWRPECPHHRSYKILLMLEARTWSFPQMHLHNCNSRHCSWCSLCLECPSPNGVPSKLPFIFQSQVKCHHPHEPLVIFWKQHSRVKRIVIKEQGRLKFESLR